MEDSIEYLQINAKFIRTTITSSGSTVADWITSISLDFPAHKHNIIVGLDIQCNISNTAHGKKERRRVATLHLCVGYKCIIVKLLHIDYIPRALKKLLYNMRYVFVGVDAENKVLDLQENYSELVCRRYRDLAEVAKEDWSGARRLSRYPEIKELAREVAGLKLFKPNKRLLGSDWESEILTDEQVYYACVNAYASCKVGRKLDQLGSE